MDNNPDQNRSSYQFWHFSLHLQDNNRFYCLRLARCCTGCSHLRYITLLNNKIIKGAGFFGVAGQLRREIGSSSAFFASSGGATIHQGVSPTLHTILLGMGGTIHNTHATKPLNWVLITIEFRNFCSKSISRQTTKYLCYCLY